MKMKISTKGRYAIKWMIDLATYDNGEPVRIKDVAKRQWTDIIQSLYVYMHHVHQVLMRHFCQSINTY